MYRNFNEGWIEVIAGCMFAGKTEELIKRIKVLELAKKKIKVFKPKIDNRYSDDEIVSHSGLRVKCLVVDKAREILELINNDDEVILIDEVQFFDDEIVAVCDLIASRSIPVICAGLDLDFRACVFGPMGKLMAIAEYVTKLTAVCSVCGNPATRTQRLVNGKPAKYNDPTILVGANEAYEPRCRTHHKVKGKYRSYYGSKIYQIRSNRKKISRIK